MKLQLTVLDGGRAGLSAVFSSGQVTIGRHPDNSLQFDPEHDLDVSAHHALFARSGTRWIVRDLGSRNGTLVNGHPIRAETTLDDTDQVRLGTDGPTIEVRLVADSVADRKPDPLPKAAAAPRTPAPSLRRTAGVVQPPAARRSSTTQRIRVEVGKQTRTLRILSGLLVVVILAGSGYVVWDRRQQGIERARERGAFQARIDSIVAASEASIVRLRGEMDGLVGALQRSQDQVQQLQRDLVSAEAAGQASEVARLRQALSGATQSLALQQAAARVDFQRIYALRNPAVAMIWTDFGPGDVTTGTAFAVTPDGVMITNRHVVYGADGTRRPRRIAIQFSNSPQVWRATVLGVGVSAEADVAAIRVQGIVGTVPAIPLPDSVTTRVGDPIATIGFPLGTALPMRGSGEENLVRTTLTAGTVAKALPDLLQIDGYGAEGASGSPIFDGTGTLLGVLFGGEAGSDGRVVYAVPVPYVTSLLTSLQISF